MTRRWEFITEGSVDTVADKRTQITKMAIKEGLLELLGKSPFNFITVSGVCREAGVGRATFYKHYSGLADVLDELADDAVDATRRSGEDPFSAISTLAEKMRKNPGREELEPYMELLPICQRVADNPKYRLLFTDPFISEYILMRIYRREREHVLPVLMERYRVSREEADKLFLYNIHGAFAVNRSMGWKKNEDWYRVQKVLLTFQEGGYNALNKL